MSYLARTTRRPTPSRLRSAEPFQNGRTAAFEPPFSFGSKLVANRPKWHACKRAWMMANLEPISYSDQQIRRILETVRTIAMVGASSNWNRPSYFVMKYLQGKGYRVIPVNPGIAGQELLGETVYASLRDIPDQVDMVDVFRPAKEAVGIVQDAIAIGAPAVWMQLGIRHDEAAALGEAAGIEVIMNRCPKIEFGRLAGELSWSGVNSATIQNRAPQAPRPRNTKERPSPSHHL